ncbi:uncharacterized protein KGF55_005040 [Candida pseudojiufengensis]|uniref:uncharacterized protein n=1 Tax=Candida pseudojiufengensis TaxID=497109 RepID=UPI002225261A|nr:uncharacterized protein KGF55_005040 [Candida pseudojiufengensis]KAI5959808.1 hypothetical protein KGF55_005040 [Candida pseudojiufengensis]
MSTNSSKFENSLGSSRSPINLNSNTLQSNLDNLINSNKFKQEQQELHEQQEKQQAHEAEEIESQYTKSSNNQNSENKDASKADAFVETPFMPKMANETLKAELGRSSWKLFHTILARYPENPTIKERTTLGEFINLFSKVYPCGDCARHFQTLLSKYPPQTKNRKIAAIWGCDIHNKVNLRLNKPEYDCTTILEDYDCGCGLDELESDDTLSKGSSIDSSRKSKINEDSDNGSLKDLKNIKSASTKDEADDFLKDLQKHKGNGPFLSNLEENSPNSESNKNSDLTQIIKENDDHLKNLKIEKEDLQRGG